jgi:predicted nucleotidyltransferase
MSKTVGIAPLLREALSPLREEISVAFIHGSVAEGREESGSDVDLIVVGKVRPSRLAVALRQARETLAREVNPTVYSTKEFAQKLSKGHHFIAAVMRKPKVFLIGNEHELGRIAGDQTGRSRGDNQRGNR